MKIAGVEIFVEPVKEHRFVVVFRASGLGGDVADTDPQATGVPPLAPKSHKSGSEKTAEVAAEFIAQAHKLLAGEKKANGLTLRGFSARPRCRPMKKSMVSRPPRSRSIRCTRGLASLVGMEIVGKAQTLSEQIDVLTENWSKYDFFFIHFKYTDSTGEDGAFANKVKRTEELDAIIPRITALKPAC